MPVARSGSIESSLIQDVTSTQRKTAKAAARSGAIPPMAELNIALDKTHAAESSDIFKTSILL